MLFQIPDGMLTNASTVSNPGKLAWLGGTSRPAFRALA
jgi:hypothetical protein